MGMTLARPRAEVFMKYHKICIKCDVVAPADEVLFFKLDGQQAVGRANRPMAMWFDDETVQALKQQYHDVSIVETNEGE